MTSSSSPTAIEQLQNLRLLPPPFNELAPVLSTIISFSTATLVFGSTSLSGQWKSVVDEIMTSMSWTDYETMWVVATWSTYMATYWGYCLLIHGAEHLFPLTLKNFKIQPNEPIASWSEVAKMAPLVLFNQICLGLPMFKAMFWLRTQLDGDIEKLMYHIPSIPMFAGTLFLTVFCVESWFYMIHRLLHTPFLYKHVHSLHHQYKAPSCFESVYVHPVEYMMNSLTVLMVGPLLGRVPLVQMCIWMVVGTFLQVHDHSGYWFPFMPSVLMHDYHHQKFKCCYGIIGMLDGILGTELEFGKFVQEHHSKTPCNQLNSNTKKE